MLSSNQIHNFETLIICDKDSPNKNTFSRNQLLFKLYNCYTIVTSNKSRVHYSSSVVEIYKFSQYQPARSKNIKSCCFAISWAKESRVSIKVGVITLFCQCSFNVITSIYYFFIYFENYFDHCMRLSIFSTEFPWNVFIWRLWRFYKRQLSRQKMSCCICENKSNFRTMFMEPDIIRSFLIYLSWQNILYDINREKNIYTFKYRPNSNCTSKNTSRILPSHEMRLLKQQKNEKIIYFPFLLTITIHLSRRANF